MTTPPDPNCLPLERIPEGWNFWNLSREGHEFRCRLLGPERWARSGAGASPRAAFLAALETVTLWRSGEDEQQPG